MGVDDLDVRSVHGEAVQPCRHGDHMMIQRSRVLSARARSSASSSGATFGAGRCSGRRWRRIVLAISLAVAVFLGLAVAAIAHHAEVTGVAFALPFVQ